MKTAGVLALLVAAVSGGGRRDVVAHRWSAAGAGSAGGPAAAPPAAVEAAKVKVDRVTVQIDAVGTLEPAEAVAMAPEIDGILAEILFREGTPGEGGPSPGPPGRRHPEGGTGPGPRRTHPGRSQFRARRHAAQAAFRYPARP